MKRALGLPDAPIPKRQVVYAGVNPFDSKDLRDLFRRQFLTVTAVNVFRLVSKSWNVCPTGFKGGSMIGTRVLDFLILHYVYHGRTDALETLFSLLSLPEMEHVKKAESRAYSNVIGSHSLECSAVRGDSAEVLSWLHSHGVGMNRDALLHYGIVADNLSVVQWLFVHDRYRLEQTNFWSSEFCVDKPMPKSVKMLKWMQGNLFKEAMPSDGALFTGAARLSDVAMAEAASSGGCRKQPCWWMASTETSFFKRYAPKRIKYLPGAAFHLYGKSPYSKEAFIYMWDTLKARPKDSGARVDWIKIASRLEWIDALDRLVVGLGLSKQVIREDVLTCLQCRLMGKRVLLHMIDRYLGPTLIPFVPNRNYPRNTWLDSETAALAIENFGEPLDDYEKIAQLSSHSPNATAVHLRCMAKVYDTTVLQNLLNRLFAVGRGGAEAPVVEVLVEEFGLLPTARALNGYGERMSPEQYRIYGKVYTAMAEERPSP